MLARAGCSNCAPQDVWKIVGQRSTSSKNEERPKAQPSSFTLRYSSLTLNAFLTYASVAKP